MNTRRNWELLYDRKALVIEITIRESGGARLDSFKFNQADKKLQNKIYNLLNEKYGIDFKPVIEEKEAPKDKGFFES